jgi:hypothetical protein
MKNTLLAFSALAVSLTACSQKIMVNKIYAYKTETLPGNIKADRQGRQTSPRIYISYRLYTESNVNIKWDKVWIDGKNYTVRYNEVKGFPIHVGKTNEKQEEIFINHKAGTKVFFLELDLDETDIPAPAAVKTDGMILRGYYKNKTIIKTVNLENIILLYTYPSV